MPRFIELHFKQHAQCLAHFFDVTVIDRSADYDRICDTYQPDLVLFESGVYAGTADRQISNVFTHSHIPKVGFCHADAFCFSRSIFFSDMDRWGVQTFFSLSLAMAEYTPAIADQLFVWPNSIDSDLYRDYGQSKVIPISITGSQAPLYPWRNQITSVVSQHYPALTAPHFGWGDERLTFRMIHGESYARMLNASWLVPACGTMAHDLARKHLEIPGCRACLLTERTAAVEAAGFRDMENCVFVTEDNVLKKVDFLLRHRDALQSIIDAGYSLVHGRHTMRHRRQIFDWFLLHENLQPNEIIVQPGPFEPLCVTNRSSGIRNGHVRCDGIDRQLLAEGDRHLMAGRYTQAEKLYVKCLKFYPMSEPKLRLALTALHKGNASEALRWITEPLSSTIGSHKSLDPDPVEWAYFIVALLCQGDLAGAAARATQFASLHHQELDRVRSAVSVLDPSVSAVLRTAQGRQRYSVHQLFERTPDEWFRTLCLLLRACNQVSFSERLAASHPGAARHGELVGTALVAFSCRTSPIVPTATDRARALPLRPASRFSTLQLVTLRRIGSCLVNIGRRLEMLMGPLLPYRFSTIRRDPFISSVEAIARSAGSGRLLVVCGGSDDIVTEAFLYGLEQNPCLLEVVFVAVDTSRFALLRRLYRSDAATTRATHIFHPRAGKDVAGDFDIVLVGRRSRCAAAAAHVASRARTVILACTADSDQYRIYRTLIEDPHYFAADIDGDSDGAILRRRTGDDPELFMDFDISQTSSDEEEMRWRPVS